MAKRRASGEGSIRKRSDGRWEGRYVAGHDANGKPIRRNVLGKTQAEARAKLRLAIEAAETLDVARAGEYTVEKWVRTWYELYSKPNIREKTQAYYETFINRHIIPILGGIKLEKLTGRDIQRMYNEVRAHGRIRAAQKDSNPGMSASYVRGLHMMMHNCLNRAVKERLILRNPTEDCIVPKVEKTEMKILKPEDIGAYLKEADRRGVMAIFYLELCTGLRKGELTALLWEDLNVEAKTISVSKQAVGVKGGGVKIASSPEEARHSHKPQQAEEQLFPSGR